MSSVSAMVFMEDSGRAAEIALERGIDAGLHLNFTTPFSGPTSPMLIEHQRRIGAYLLGHRLAQVIFHPGSFIHLDMLLRLSATSSRDFTAKNCGALTAITICISAQTCSSAICSPSGRLRGVTFHFNQGRRGRSTVSIGMQWTGFWRAAMSSRTSFFPYSPWSSRLTCNVLLRQLASTPSRLRFIQ